MINQYKNYNSIFLGIFFIFQYFFGIIYLFFFEVDSWLHFTIQGMLAFTAIFIYFISQYKIKLIYSINIINTFIAAFLLYNVIGSLLMSIGSDILVSIKLREFNIEPQEGFIANGLNYFGFGISLVVATTLSHRFSVFNFKQAKDHKTILYVYFLLFTLISCRLYIFLINLNVFIYPSIGIVNLLAIASNGIIGLFIYFKSKFNIYAILTTLFLSILGVIELNKTNALLPIIVLFLSLSIRYNSRLLAISIVPVSFFYLNMIYPGINYARININIHHNSPLTIVTERISQISKINREKFDLSNKNLVVDMFRINNEVLNSERGSSIWYRLCYVTEQAAAIRFYNSGSPSGENLRQIYWVFLPRIFFPDKPKFSNYIGPELYYRMTGFKNSSTSSGIFIEGYFRGGFLGLLFNSFSIGIIIGLCQLLLKLFLKHEFFYFIPIAVILFIIPLSIDGHFIINILGTFIALIYLLFLFLIIFYHKNIYEFFKK